MALKQPKSMSEVLYFTNRTLLPDGKAKAWAFKIDCPKCGKAKMGKPIDPKTKKPKIRAKEYVCPACNYSEEKSEHEAKLTLDVIYTCPECKKEGEGSCPYKRKTYLGVPSFIVLCDHCGAKIAITKKMKIPKKKKK